MTDSTRTPWHRIVVALTIGSFSIAALIGIAALLGAGDIGTPELQILGTTFLMGCSSMVVLTYLATAGTPYLVFGGLGAVADAVAVVTALILIWGDTTGPAPDLLLKLFGVATVAALTLAQVCLLAVVARRRPTVAPVLWGTIAVATVLAALVSALILGSDIGDSGARTIGIVAIVDVLGTIVTIALAAFGDDPTVDSAGGPLSVELSTDVADRLRRRGAETGRTPSDLVAEAVERWLAAIDGTADRQA